MATPRATIPDLPEQAAVVGSDLLVVQNGATTKKMTVGLLTTSATSVIDAHITNPTGAHVASAISAAPNADPMNGIDVQTQLSQSAGAIGGLSTSITANTTALADHLADPENAHAASAVGVIPTGNLNSIDVQAALVELQTALDNVQLIEGPKGDTGAPGLNGDWSTPQPIEVMPGATYNVGAGDAGKLKKLTAVATVTLPSDVLEIGQRVDFVCVGGPATFTLGSGATWDVPPTPTTNARTTGSFVSAIKMAATAWALAGDLG